MKVRPWFQKQWKNETEVRNKIYVYLGLMHLTRTSTNLLYMCRFKYVFSTLSLPCIPICFLTDGCSSKNWRFWARALTPGRPIGWRRPVTLWSTISFVPPASVPRTCSKNRNQSNVFQACCFNVNQCGIRRWIHFLYLQRFFCTKRVPYKL